MFRMRVEIIVMVIKRDNLGIVSGLLLWLRVDLVLSLGLSFRARPSAMARAMVSTIV